MGCRLGERGRTEQTRDVVGPGGGRMRMSRLGELCLRRGERPCRRLRLNALLRLTSRR